MRSIPSLINLRRATAAAPDAGAAMVVALVSLVVVTAFATTLFTAVETEKHGRRRRDTTACRR